jgi:transposase
MATGNRYPQEIRERAVRMVVEHRDEYRTEWAALASISGKLGMTPETLRTWLLRRANEILKAASIFFAGELDPRRPKL